MKNNLGFVVLCLLILGSSALWLSAAPSERSRVQTFLVPTGTGGCFGDRDCHELCLLTPGGHMVRTGVTCCVPAEDVESGSATSCVGYELR